MITTGEGATATTQTLDFFYDANGTPLALKTNNTVYYYVTNLQGDVIQLVDSTGTAVAAYEYDPFGNIVSQSGDLADLNPLRYRGYYYDKETGFYYLQSRYYDPKIGRFINADSYASTGQGIIGHNMYIYCLNNPLSYTDPNGEIAIFDDILVVILVFVVGYVTIGFLFSPPIQALIRSIAQEIADFFSALMEQITEIYEAKTKGKQRMRDSGLAQESDQEILQKSQDNNLPSSERKKYVTEAKARGLRNKIKRKEIYRINLE